MPSEWEQEILGHNDSNQQLQMILLYLTVACCVLAAYAFGCLGLSGAWPTLLLAVLFHLWRSRISRLTRSTVQLAALMATRRRAMSGAESAEWLNFLVNRWWAFSAESLQSAVKRALDYQLEQRKPAFLQSVSLDRFSLGEDTPCIRELRAFETTEANQSLVAATWSNAGRPPQEVYRSSQYSLVLESQLELHCDQFRMDFATRLSRLGMGPSISFGQLSLSGRLQLCVQLDLTARFPHVAKVTASFREPPEIYYNMKIIRSVNAAFIPVLGQWLRQAIEESLTKAMVDPGELVLYTGQDPMAPLAVDASKVAKSAATSASVPSLPVIGVITVTLRISKAAAAAAAGAVPAAEGQDVASSGVRICTMSLGPEQRLVSREFPAGSPCTQAASFFVRDLASEELHIHLKSKGLLGGVAPVAKWIISLKEQPLKSTKVVQVSEVQKSARLNAQLEYTELPALQLESVQPSQVYTGSGRAVLSGALYIKVHGASNLLGMDRTGQSDPYCVVFANRRKVGSTQYVKQTKNPKFDCEFHAFVADYTKTTVSFFLYDYDGRNALRDDFLGACHVQLQKDNPAMLFHQLPLGYSVAKHGQVASSNMGNLLFSIVFRPVAPVAKSEIAKANSGQLTDEELMTLQCADASSNRISVSSEEGVKKDSTADDNYSMNAGSFLARGLGVMEFHLIGAKNLMAMDRGGTSDPFVEVRIGEDLLFRSKVSKATLEPRWNEWVTTRCPKESEKLKLTVWDKDRIGKDFLGDLLLSVEDLRSLSESASTRWFNLSGKGVRSGRIELGCKIVSEGLSAGSKLESIGGNSLSSSVGGNGFSFTVHSARNFAGGKAVEACVKVTSSASGKSSELFRTKMEKKSQQPYWGQKFDAPMGVEPILFTVLSKNSFNKTEPIGSVELSLESIACLSTSSGPVWHTLTDSNGETVGELSLECNMTSGSERVASGAATADATAAKLSKSSDKSIKGRPVTFRLIAGRQLMAADFGGKSDPFVRVTLGTKLLYKSRIVKRSLEPQWNEEFTVPVPANHAVTFTVLDYDAVGKNDFLGEVSLDPITASARGESWYQLKGSKVKSGEILISCQLPAIYDASAIGSVEAGEIDVDEAANADVFEDASGGAELLPSVDQAGRTNQDIELASAFVADAGGLNSPHLESVEQQPQQQPPPPPPLRLKQPQKVSTPSHVEVTIVSGSSLMAADLDGTSDPYVIATLAGRQVHKTRVRRSTLNPVWRESFHIQLPDEGHLLRLATYDKDPVGKDDFLGEISLTRDNLLQMCMLKEESLLKLAGKNVTSGHLLLRCRRSPSPGGEATAPASASVAAVEEANSSFSEDLQQLSPPLPPTTTLSTANNSSVSPPNTFYSDPTGGGDSRSLETISAADTTESADISSAGGVFQCDLLRITGAEKLPKSDRIYIKIKGDTSRRGGIGGRDLYKTRSYDVPPPVYGSDSAAILLDATESFRLQSDNLTTLSLLLKSSDKHKTLDICSHSVANLVARAGGPAIAINLPETGVSLALRLTRLPSGPASSSSHDGGGGGFGSLLRRRGDKRKSGFRNSANVATTASGGAKDAGSNV